MPSKFSLVVVMLLAATTALAGTRKYKAWIETPEAYFLTASEREAWSKVSTDQQAEEFVLRYFEKRGAPFREELAHRIEMADKHLTVGKKRGSETLRGKIVILFGPPSKIDRIDRTQVGALDLSEAGAALSNVSVMGGNSTAVRITPTVDTFTWTGERIPKPLTDRIVVTIEYDLSGKERVVGTKKELERLSELFETIAAASMSSSPSR